MPKLFGKQKFLLAFEYGLAIARTAHQMKVELTPELVAKAEEMLLNEASTHTASHFGNNMVPNIMSVFELDMTK